MPEEHSYDEPLQQYGGHPHIRLLQLQGAQDSDMPLLGQLLGYALHNQEVDSFEALSYTWGNSSPSEVIMIDGRIFRIRKFLFEALRRLRFSNGPRLLWIDAICINQRDAIEKTQQVPLMGQIYATAERVIVWLGEGSSPENDGKAYDLLLWASPHRTLHPWRKSGGPWNLPPLSTILHTFNDLKGHNLSNTLSVTSDVTREDIEQFLARPWFSRRWIVQELCNACEVILLFGRYELSWLDFSAALDTLASAPDDSRSLQKYSANSLMIWRNGVIGESVLKAMEIFHTFEGGDDRDRMAAFLTLGWPHSLQGSDFIVDYSRPVDENYYRLAIHMIDIGEGAELLITASNCIRSRNVTQNSLPSWVPDWRTITQRKLRASLYGTFDVGIRSGKFLEFSGRVDYMITTDVNRATTFNTVADESESKILPKRGDMICRLISREGRLDLNSVVLRRHEQSDLYCVLIGNPMLYDLADSDWAGCLSIPEYAAESRHFLVI